MKPWLPRVSQYEEVSGEQGKGGIMKTNFRSNAIEDDEDEQEEDVPSSLMQVNLMFGKIKYFIFNTAAIKLSYFMLLLSNTELKRLC